MRNIKIFKSYKKLEKVLVYDVASIMLILKISDKRYAL